MNATCSDRERIFEDGTPAEWTALEAHAASCPLCAEEVRACGAEPVLCETPGTEFDRDATYTILGVEKFCAENGIRVVRVDRATELAELAPLDECARRYQ